MTPTATLTRCFAALPLADLRRLVWHVEQRTRILCGDESLRLTDFDGGG